MSEPQVEANLVLVMVYLRFDPALWSARAIAQRAQLALEHELSGSAQIWRYEYLEKVQS